MRALKELKELILSEVDKVNQKNDITPGELETMYYAVDIIKDIDEILGDNGHSERGYITYNGASYRRGRDRDTGRYVSRDGSYNSYDRMISRLEDMRSHATDEHTKRMVDRWMDEMENS
jgi:hypothetical protein